MSQEKVDRYKQQKMNRKEIMRKERAKHIMRQCVICVAVLALFSWLGYSAYSIHDSNKPRQTAEVEYAAMQSYLEGISGK